MAPNIFKIGVGRGAHLLNCLSGGKSIQHATNHYGRGAHILKYNINGEGYNEIEVPSNHTQLMVSGPKGFAYGWANEAYYKKGQDFLRRYANKEERAKADDDEEIIFYDDTNSLCIEFDPTEGDARCKDLFFDTLWKGVNHKLS